MHAGRRRGSGWYEPFRCTARAGAGEWLVRLQGHRRLAAHDEVEDRVLGVLGEGDQAALGEPPVDPGRGDHVRWSGLSAAVAVQPGPRFPNASCGDAGGPIEQSLQSRAQGGGAVWNGLGLRETSCSATSALRTRLMRPCGWRSPRSSDWRTSSAWTLEHGDRLLKPGHVSDIERPGRRRQLLAAQGDRVVQEGVERQVLVGEVGSGQPWRTGDRHVVLHSDRGVVHLPMPSARPLTM